MTSILLQRPLPAGDESLQRTAYVVLFTLVVISLFNPFYPLLRYVKYLAMPLLLLLYVAGIISGRQPLVHLKQYTMPFIVLLCGYLVFLPRASLFAVKDGILTCLRSQQH